MSTIVVFGGTGYTGGHIVREAASRGHQVISVSRTRPNDPVAGVRYEIGSAEQLAPELIPGADAVVATLSPPATWPVASSRSTATWPCRPQPQVPATCRS